MTHSRSPLILFTLLATISMGAVAQEATGEQSDEIEVIADIPAGSELTFDHSIEITGSVGSGARIKINKGGTKIHGDLQDHVTLETQQGSTVIVASGSSIAISSGSAIVITQSHNGQSLTIINGKPIAAGKSGNPGGLSGIEIQGNVGRHANLKTDASIVVAGNVGAASSLKANGSIEASGDIGSGSSLAAGGSLHVLNMGDNVNADAGGSIEALNIGSKANLDAGGSIRVGDVSTGATLDAGGSVSAGTIAPGANANAGGSITTQAADANDLSAGGTVRIGGRMRRSVDFDPE